MRKLTEYDQQYFMKKYDCNNFDQVCNLILIEGLFVGRDHKDPEVQAFIKLMSVKVKANIEKNGLFGTHGKS